MAAVLASMVGTATSVRLRVGMPARKVQAGQRRADSTSSGPAQLTSETASWLVAITATTASAMVAHTGSARPAPSAPAGRAGAGGDQRDGAPGRAPGVVGGAELRGARAPARQAAVVLQARAALVDQAVADVGLSGLSGSPAPARSIAIWATSLSVEPCCAWQSPRRRGGSGRGWRSPCRRYTSAGSWRSACSTTLMASTKSRQSIAAEQAQAADAVADGDLVGGLVLALQLDHLLDRQPLFASRCSSQSGRSPGPGSGPGGARQLGDEGAGQRRVGLGHVGQHQDQVAAGPSRRCRPCGRPTRRRSRGRRGRRRCGRPRGAGSRSAPAAA